MAGRRGQRFRSRGGGAPWRVEAYPRPPILDAELGSPARARGGGRGVPPHQIAEEVCPSATGWRKTAALSAAAHRAFLSSTVRTEGAGVPAGAIAVEIDAATAFGTGEHPSTRGVLLALDGLARRRRIRRPLDIGTGSGILAIAAAKRLRRRVLGEPMSMARRPGSPPITSGATGWPGRCA